MSLDNLGEMKTEGLKVSEFATLPAIKGKQFGRDVYSSIILFKDLRKFLETFPSVQRDISKPKVKSIKRYILSGMDMGSEDIMRFFSAVTVTCRGILLYDDVKKQVAVDIFNSKLSINDGQNRFGGISEALDELEKRYVNTNDKEEATEIRRKLEALSYMAIPVVIFNGLGETQEKQLFHDLNNLATRPSRNTNILLNQTDIYSKLSREIADNNKYISHLGVEYGKMSIHKANPNNILLTTIYNSIKELYSFERRYNKTYLTEENYEKVLKLTNDTFNKIFYALPGDLNVKGKYVFEKSYTLRGICKVVNNLRNDRVEGIQLNEDDIYKVIAAVDWRNDNERFWGKYGGSITKRGFLVFGGGESGGFRAVVEALTDKAKDPSILEMSLDEIKEKVQGRA